MRAPTLAGSADAVAPRRYDPIHVIWFFAGITAGVMAVAVVGQVSGAHRGAWQLLSALLVIGCFLGAAVLLLARGSWVPAGLLATAAVWLVPVAGRALERLLGVWPSEGDIVPGQDFEWAPFALALLTVLAGLAVFAAFRFPFVFLTVAWALLIGALLLVPLWSGSNGFFSSDDAFIPFAPSPAWSAVNTVFAAGVLLFLVGVALDLRHLREEAFWWHVVGLFAVAFGLACHCGGGRTWGWIVMIAGGAALLALSGPIRRATWATYGVLGIYATAIHYATRWFSDWWEPVVLGIVSLGLLVLGIAFKRAGVSWSRDEPPDAPQPPSDFSAPASD